MSGIREGARGWGPKIRNPNIEIRNKSEIQNQRLKTRMFCSFSFRILNLFRISIFGFRISTATCRLQRRDGAEKLCLEGPSRRSASRRSSLVVDLEIDGRAVYHCHRVADPLDKLRVIGGPKVAALGIGVHQQLAAKDLRRFCASQRPSRATVS